MMEENKIYACCFFGHRKIPKKPDIEERLYREIENLIVNRGVFIFLFGSKSEFCIIYYDEQYAPQKRKKSNRDAFTYQPKSGTKIAYEYAVKKGKQIINVI